jgi:hypothetical protein
MDCTNAKRYPVEGVVLADNLLTSTAMNKVCEYKTVQVAVVNCIQKDCIVLLKLVVLQTVVNCYVCK